MQENLKVTRYNNGDSLLSGFSNAAWAALDSGAYCYYNNSPANNPMFGKLYNWFAVADPRGLCPADWRVPTDSEWKALVYYLDNSADTSCSLCLQSFTAGGLLKETGFARWNAPNALASNATGFTASAGGTRDQSGGFWGNMQRMQIWSSTAHVNGTHAYNVIIQNQNGTTYRHEDYFAEGNSIRCIYGNSMTGGHENHPGKLQHLYPNPNKGRIFSEQPFTNGTMKVIAAQGTCILQMKTINGIQSLHLPETVPNGFYILQFENEKGELTGTQKLFLIR